MAGASAQHPAAGPAAEAGEAVTGVKVTPAQAHAAVPGKSGGLPQFRMEYWGGQIVWLLILFALLYVLLSRVFVPRIRRVLDERETTISAAVEEGRRVRREAQAQSDAAEAELAEARARAGRLASEAKSRAAAESAARQQAQEAELNGQIGAAEARIRIVRDEGMSHVRAIAGETAASIAEKLTGRAPSSAELDAALAANPRAA